MASAIAPDRPEIEHAHVPILRQARERELDQRLGFRRGISTAGDTREASPQNSRLPVR